MAHSLRGKDLISIYDLSLEEINLIFETARFLKVQQKNCVQHEILKGKSLGMIFQKSSTRTRVSFEVGMYQLGGHALNLSSKDIQLGAGKETIGDTAQVLSRYVDGIMARTYSHKDIEDLAEYGTVPVINGLSDLLHPCQGLTDIFTVLEKKQRMRGLKFTYIGDGNNVCHSLMYACSKVGMDMVVCCPKNYHPREDVTKMARDVASELDAGIDIIEDPFEAAKDADVIYTDVWASMGQETEKAEREKHFAKYQVNDELLSVAKKNVMVEHCLPANRGQEITDEVMDGPHSVVFDQAENRMHVQKAILSLLMG